MLVSANLQFRTAFEGRVRTPICIRSDISIANATNIRDLETRDCPDSTIGEAISFKGS
jgi:hypothetical protein